VAKVARTESNGKGKQRATTIEDADSDEEQGDPMAGLEADYFAEEDAEGRMYGGGLTRQQKVSCHLSILVYD
jgi:hypothetical protein